MVKGNEASATTLRSAVQLYVRTLVVGLMCGFLYMSVSIIDTRSVGPAGMVGLRIGLQVLFAIFLGGLCYDRMWKLGDTDRNAVNFGRRAEEKCRGLYIGLLADIPAALAFIGLIANFCGVGPSNYLAIYRILHFAFCPMLLNITLAPTVAGLSPLFLLPIGATLLLLPLTCWVGYLLGYHHYSVSDHLIYQGKGKHKKKHR